MPAPNAGGRPRWGPKPETVNGILYVLGMEMYLAQSTVGFRPPGSLSTTASGPRARKPPGRG